MSRIEQILDSENKFSCLAKLCNLLKYEISVFNYENNYDDLNDIFIYISSLLNTIKSESCLEKTHETLKEIRLLVQQLLVQKPGHIKKDNTNYLFLKNVINNIEAIEISFLSDYVDKYQGKSYEFIDYLIFNVKNYPLVEMAVKKYPYIVNFMDESRNDFISKMVDKYIDGVIKYTSGKKLNDNSDILYYDKLLKLFLSIEKINYTIVTEKKNIKKIKNVITNLNEKKYNNLTKRKLIFWLNELETILEKQIINDNYSRFKYKYDIEDKFDESVISSAIYLEKNFKEDFNNSINNRYMVTIDDEDAEEIDDGLSIELLPNGNYSLGIHIADPSSYIPSNNIVMDEAKIRATSIYLSNQTIPMFPENLSKGILSLNEIFRVPVKSSYYEITPEGEVINQILKKEDMKVNKKTSYSYVNKVLNKPEIEISEKFKTTVKLLNDITTILNKQMRMSDHYIEMKRTESNASKTNILDQTNQAMKIIETCMVFENHMIAKLALQKNIPFIYRCHNVDKSFIDKLNHYKKNVEEADMKNYIEIIKAYYASAYYSTTNKGHNGLDLTAYCHRTSPLRRYADIDCNIALDKFYFSICREDKEIYEFEEMLKLDCKNINAKNKKADSFVKEYEHSYAKKLALK